MWCMDFYLMNCEKSEKYQKNVTAIFWMRYEKGKEKNGQSTNIVMQFKYDLLIFKYKCVWLSVKM